MSPGVVTAKYLYHRLHVNRREIVERLLLPGEVTLKKITKKLDYPRRFILDLWFCRVCLAIDGTFYWIIQSLKCFQN